MLLFSSLVTTVRGGRYQDDDNISKGTLTKRCRNVYHNVVEMLSKCCRNSFGVKQGKSLTMIMTTLGHERYRAFVRSDVKCIIVDDHDDGLHYTGSRGAGEKSWLPQAW